VATFDNRPVDDVIRDMAIAELAREGVQVSVERGPEGYRLLLPTGMVMFLANITRAAEDIDPGDWDEMVRRQVQGLLASQSYTQPENLSAEQLRRQVRTRLISDEETEHEDTSYARPFAPGIVQVLCVDYPQSVATLSAKTLPELPLSLYELYAVGQANTDAEPIAVVRLSGLDKRF